MLVCWSFNIVYFHSIWNCQWKERETLVNEFNVKRELKSIIKSMVTRGCIDVIPKANRNNVLNPFLLKWVNNRLVSNLWQCKVWLGFFGVDFLRVEKWTHCQIDVTCIFFYLFLNREDTVHKQSEITCIMKYSISVVSVNFTGITSFKDKKIFLFI